MKLYIYIALAVAALSAAAYYQHSQVERGKELQRQLQEKENEVFRTQLRKGRTAYDVCDDSGGLFDFGKGTCQLPGAK